MARGDLPATIVRDEHDKPVLPDERFASAKQVRELAQQMIVADETGRARMRARVDALVNGWPTVPKSVTAAKGFGWFPRVNYRESEGKIASQQTPLFDLITEVPKCISMTLDVSGATLWEREAWENSIETHWTWLLFKKWRQSFNYHLPLSQREMLVHGIGAHVWPNNNNWMPRTPRSGQILFPEGCSLDFQNEGESFLLRDFVPGTNVYSFIRNESAARARGWFPDNVWETLVQATKQNQKIKSTSEVEELQRQVRRGDYGYWQSSQVGLWLNWMFVKEYEGGISLYCIEENIGCGNKDKGYLFKKRFLFKDWREVLVLFPYDIGNGDIHSVRGLGWRTKDFYELSNRINNIMAVQILISALPQMKQNQPNIDPEKMRLMRMGGLNILPYGMEPSMMNFPPLANGGLALQNHLRDTLENNNQSMTGSTPEPKDRETKYSFQIRAHDSAAVSNGMQSLYESNYQQWQDTLYRRAIDTPKGDLPYQKMAEEFRERCRKDRVPDRALRESAVGEIEEVTSGGAGSAAIRLQAIQLIMGGPVYANAPEAKKIQIERALVSWVLGGSKVDEFARSPSDNELPDPDTSFAVQENNGLAAGGEAVIGDGQNDVTHADAHIKKAMQIAQMAQQGQMQPEQALNALQKLSEHIEQHLARLEQNPARQQEFKALEDQYKQVQEFMGQLEQAVQEQQGQQEQQQQLSEKGQLDAAKMQQDEQRKDAKMQGNEQRAWRKLAFSERIKDVSTASGMHRANAVTAANITRNGATKR